MPVAEVPLDKMVKMAKIVRHRREHAPMHATARRRSTSPLLRLCWVRTLETSVNRMVSGDALPNVRIGSRSPFWTQPLTRTGRQLDNPPGSKRLPAVDGRDEVQPIAPSQWAATRARARPAEPPSASPPTQSRSCHCPPHTSLRENMCATQKGGHEV
jgi:hypothetical protein